MKVYETFQDSKPESPHLGTKPFPQPRLVVCVGEATKLVTDPHFVLWPGVEGQLLDGPAPEVLTISAHRDIRKVGTHFVIPGRFESNKGKPTFWGTKFDWVPIATFEVWGNLSKARSGIQRHYDGFYYADVYETGSPTMQWLGSCWGNATFSANPIPSPWDSLNPNPT